VREAAQGDVIVVNACNACVPETLSHLKDSMASQRNSLGETPRDPPCSHEKKSHD